MADPTVLPVHVPSSRVSVLDMYTYVLYLATVPRSYVHVHVHVRQYTPTCTCSYHFTCICENVRCILCGIRLASFMLALNRTLTLIATCEQHRANPCIYMYMYCTLCMDLLVHVYTCTCTCTSTPVHCIWIYMYTCTLYMDLHVHVQCYMQ